LGSDYLFSFEKQLLNESIPLDSASEFHLFVYAYIVQTPNAVLHPISCHYSDVENRRFAVVSVYIFRWNQTSHAS
jgi:hypothetical protein